MTDEQLPESFIRDNLYNWLGYGNLNGRYWFIGREEFDDMGRYTYLNGIRDFYRVRRTFDYAEDFVDVWERYYGRSVYKGTTGPSTRHWQAAFLFSLRGDVPKGSRHVDGVE